MSLRSLIERAIKLIEDDWQGTSGSSEGNLWLVDAREALAQLKEFESKCSHGWPMGMCPAWDCIYSSHDLQSDAATGSCRESGPGKGICDMCAAGHYEKCRYVSDAGAAK